MPIAASAHVAAVIRRQVLIHVGFEILIWNGPSIKGIFLFIYSLVGMKDSNIF